MQQISSLPTIPALEWVCPSSGTSKMCVFLDLCGVMPKSIPHRLWMQMTTYHITQHNRTVHLTHFWLLSHMHRPPHLPLHILCRGSWEQNVQSFFKVSSSSSRYLYYTAFSFSTGGSAGSTLRSSSACSFHVLLGFTQVQWFLLPASQISIRCPSVHLVSHIHYIITILAPQIDSDQVHVKVSTFVLTSAPLWCIAPMLISVAFLNQLHAASGKSTVTHTQSTISSFKHFIFACSSTQLDPCTKYTRATFLTQEVCWKIRAE